MVKTESGEKKGQISFIAYRDKGQWYFVPLNIDSYWEKMHITDAELNADYADEIIIHNSPSGPLEILDLNATLNKDYPSIRNLTFKLRNRSSKKVTGYTLRLYTKGGDQIYGTPHDIEPGSMSDEKMDSSRYTYFCEGIIKDNLIVDEVNFSDGSTWRTPKPNKIRTGIHK